MAEDRDDIYRVLEETFVPADDAFWDDPSVVMGSESEKKRRLFEQIRRSSRNWESSGPCMYRGCGMPSIRRSHTVHRAGSIERIAEAQHVLTPRLNNRGQMGMDLLGVNLASTFPGFCGEHEQLFSEFEVGGAVTAPRHVALQAFRTLSREIARKRHGLPELEQLLRDYRKGREEYFAASILKAAPEFTFKGLTVEGDAMEERLASMIEGGKADLSELEGDLYEELFAFVSGKATDEPSLEALSLPFEAPVCCSGFGVLTYEYHGERLRALCPLGILPQEGSTILFICAARKHSIIIEQYVRDMTVGFGALNAMESWLVNGTDHWFIRPSAWQAISPVRQAKVLDLLLRDEDNIGTFLEFSILDGPRKYLITYIREYLSEADDPDAVQRMVTAEEAKLTP
jgi:hypothetical protein